MNEDKVDPGVFITLGGKQRRLAFDFWALRLLEKETGKNSLNGEVFNNLFANDLLVLVWAAIQGDEKLTIEQVGHMMSFNNVKEISEAIQLAFKQAQPAEVPESKNVNADAGEKPL